jgi:hypothetical protein
MEVTEASLAFKCPNCLRRLEVNLETDPIDVGIDVELCPVHLSHTTISFNFACSNCSQPCVYEMVSDAMPDVEEDVS